MVDSRRDQNPYTQEWTDPFNANDHDFDAATLENYEPYHSQTSVLSHSRNGPARNFHARFDSSANQTYEQDAYLYGQPTADEHNDSFYVVDDTPLSSSKGYSPAGIPYPEDDEESGQYEEIGGVSGFPDLPDDVSDRHSFDESSETNAFHARPVGYPVDDEFYDDKESDAASISGTLTSESAPDPSNKEWASRQNRSQLGRYGTRKVNLIRGEVFQAEYKVPTAVQMSILPKYRDVEGGSTEFSHMRYTAATCDPDDFTPERGYNLRAAEYGRKTELLIAITYYNEDKQLTARTMYGLMQNIRDICKLKRSAFWQNGGEAWKKITVTLVMDGIEPCDKSVLDMMATIGVYQDGVMKKNVNGEDTVAHIFEYTTQLCVTPNQKLVRPEEGNSASLPPIQIIMCLKQKNSKKINSHRWVFNAFCPILKPEVVCLIDAGTRPGHKSILYLWQAFYNNKNVGGAAGEIHAMLGDHNRNLLNPLVATQNFEYKISNILDKPLESMFGFISVLPGAFSAYRYAAVEGRPLEQYFHGDHTLAVRLGKKGVNGMGIFRKNMFLAEDRILCQEVVFKRGANWHLTYVKASKAETDVPSGIGELLGQRRRWLNGSFAAGIYGLMHFGRIYQSSHNILRIIFFHFQFLYNLLQLALSWFMLGCYYLTITIIIELAANPQMFGGSNDSRSFPFGKSASSIISIIVKYVYGLLMMISFILALGNKPKGSKYLYYGMIVFFGIIQYYALVISFWMAVNTFQHQVPSSLHDFFSNFFTSTTALVIVALASTFGLYIVSAILYLDPWHILHSFVQYLFMMPSFPNVFNVYAFSNWHDVSWGTKGSDTVDKLLPVAQVQKIGEVAIVEEVDRPLADIDDEFVAVVKRALTPYVPVEKNEVVSEEDSTKMFRTWLLIVWIVSNIVLVWSITSTSSAEFGMSDSVRQRIAYFFAVLLWGNAIIALVRLIGNVLFVTKSFVQRLFSRR